MYVIIVQSFFSVFGICVASLMEKWGNVSANTHKKHNRDTFDIPDICW